MKMHLWNVGGAVGAPRRRTAVGFLLSWLFTGLVLISPARAAEYYVDQQSLGGTCSDAHPGSLDSPWCSVTKASAMAQAGDTVYIREGTYDHQRLFPANSGTEARPIVFRNYQVEQAIIVGQYGHGANIDTVDHITIDGLIFDGDYRINTGIYLDNHADYITITNTTIRKYKNPSGEGGMGIWIGRGAASHLLVEGCTIHDIARGASESTQNGSGIHMFSNPDEPTSHIIIRNTDIYDVFTEDAIHLGAFDIVTDVLIEGCRFWDNKEDAIDMKYVERVTVRDCEAWGHHETSTGGGAGVVIHNGAQQVLIDQCSFHENDKGVSVHFNRGSRPVQDITIQRSVFYDNTRRGIFVGDNQEEMVRDVCILNNVVYNSGTDGVYIYNGPDGLLMMNNIIWNNVDRDTVYHSITRQEEFITDYNDYPGGGMIYAQGRILSIKQFQATYPEHEQHGLAVDPLFVDVENRDFHLTESSPVIDRGTDVGLAYSGEAPDMGAYEFIDPQLDPPSAPTGLRIMP